ncbi:MAG TPA: hypothetical protein VFA93_02600 [Patescibacteria group bacterium]|nr:hypothetical protein [Patescibacteria group bacterium]
MSVERITSVPEQTALPLSPKLPRETIQNLQRILQKQIREHPLSLEATSKNFKLESLSKPFEFEESTEIVNNNVTFKLEKDKENPKIRRFTVTKTYSLSGPMIVSLDDMDKIEDRGPFVKMETCLTFNNEDPHISYSWSISDNSAPPKFYEDTQEAVDLSQRHVKFLAS